MKQDKFSEEEKAAMKARIEEMKKEGKRTKADGEADVLAAIAAMQQPSRGIGEKLHKIIKANAPSLSPRTWYGMPAYSNSNGKIVLFFRGADKFKERYLTLGFNDSSQLDDGNMWPIAYAIVKLTAAEQKTVAEIVKKAVP